MKTFDIFRQAVDSELLLKEVFVKTAEYHKTKHEIYYECQAFASIADEHARYLKKKMDRYPKTENASATDKFHKLIPEPLIGNDLADDLHYLWLLTCEAEFFGTLLLQSATATNDSEFEKACNLFTEEHSKQSHWLIERINREVSRLLPVAGQTA